MEYFIIQICTYLSWTICGIIVYLFYTQYQRSQKWRKSLRGKVVLVTGSANGLGKELCLAFARENCHIICVDVDTKGNNDTVQKINEISTLNKVYSYTVDITKVEKVKELHANIKKEFHDGIDILVNNAGVAYLSPFFDVTDEHIQRLIEINLLAQFWLIRSFLPQMIERNSGHIVAVGSIAGVQGVGCLVPYCSSKFAITGLMEALTSELLHMNSNVKTLVVMPSVMKTRLLPNDVYKKGVGYQLINGFPIKVSDTRDVALGIINSIKDERRIYGVPYLHYMVAKSIKLLPEFLYDFVLKYLLNLNHLVDELTNVE